VTEEHDLHDMVGGIVRRAERSVDVDRELAAFHERRRFGSAGQRFDEPLGRRRGTLLAVAASTVLVIGVGTLVLARRDGHGITTGTDAPAAPTLAPPTATATTDGGATTDGEATTTNDVTPTLPPLPAEFSFVEPADGVVGIAADTPLQPATLVPAATVPVSAGHGAQWARVTATSFASFDIRTGQVTVFDVDGTVVGATTLANTSGDLTLRSIAVGPQNTLYALYAFDLDPTLIVASTLSDPTRTITTWQPGPFCEFACLLTPTDTGFAWEGGTVPYVDANGNELVGPARPVDPTFTTSYSSESDVIPKRVDIVGPDEAPEWHLRIEGIEFDNDFGRRFVRQPDGSFTNMVRLETVVNDPSTRWPALLWLTSDGRVVAIDAGSVPGLLDVVVTADGRLIGVADQGDGLMEIGELTPTGG
jgi:hypothetical protein